MAASARLLQCVVSLNLATALFATVNSAAEEPTYEHGLSFFHELKYSADFTHFDYVNPDAPKGGALVVSTGRDFNTLSIFTDLLPAPATTRWMYDSLVSNRSEEMSGFYGRDPSEIRKTVQVPIHIVNDEQKAADLRGGQDWKMIGPPQYVIDRAQDFIDAGVDEFTFNMIPNDPEVYAELNETVLSAFD